jgi:hypothetical protein
MKLVDSREPDVTLPPPPQAPTSFYSLFRSFCILTIFALAFLPSSFNVVPVSPLPGSSYPGTGYLTIPYT